MIEIQMKLTRQQELIICVGLVGYLAFIPEPEPLRAFLSSSIGKVIFLGLVAYKILCVSPAIGVLLALVYARHERDTVWEHLDVAPKQCKCKMPDYTPNSSNTACTDKDGKEDKSVGSIICQCPDGYAWDLVKKECKPTQTNQSPPVAPVTPSALPTPIDTQTSSAPASGGTTTNTNLPMTTGSAAAQAISSAGPQAASTGGAQPATSTSSTSAPV